MRRLCLLACLLMLGFGLGAAWAADDKAEAPADEKAPTAAAEKATGASAHASSEHGSGDHGHGGGHHDDPGHGNATDALNDAFPPGAFNFDLSVATFVVFVLLLTILSKFAWGPIATALDSREQHIADMIATAEKNAHASEHRMKELEAQLAAQADAAREAIGQARREGEMQKEKILAEAQAAAAREKEKALEEIRAAKNVALREIAQKSVNTAVDLAKNIIHREVKPADHAKLIEDSLAQFHNHN